MLSCRGVFAVLEHHETASNPAALAAAPEPPAVHWDLLVEIPGQERLATWQLSENPAETDGPIAARRIADHRRIYLEYEGPLTGDRGWVRRIDRGEAHVRQVGGTETEVILELHGRVLNGVFEITTAGPALSFRRV